LKSGYTVGKNIAIDEFRRYSIAGSAVPAIAKFDPIGWWKKPSLPYNAGSSIYSLSSNTCKGERAFSSTKKLITPERNSIGDNTIEASEYLRAWWNNGLIKRL
jgi:hypothetical protein